MIHCPKLPQKEPRLVGEDARRGSCLRCAWPVPQQPSAATVPIVRTLATKTATLDTLPCATERKLQKAGGAKGLNDVRISQKFRHHMDNRIFGAKTLIGNLHAMETSKGTI